jgi:5-(carboxyamino)imidazole ribonucleotide synthase
LKIIQDKGKQKLFYQNNNIPTSPFLIAQNKEEAKEKTGTKPLLKKVAVKASTGGYDGKGVFISDVAPIIENPSIIPFDSELMIEEICAL